MIKFIIIVFLSLSLYADQYAWIDLETAKKARSILDKMDEVQEFCKPCNDTKANLLKYQYVNINKEDDQYFSLSLEDKSIDLAYIYVKENDLWVNLALKLELNPQNVDKKLSKAQLNKTNMTPDKWEYKDWSVSNLNEQGYLKAITHGTAIWGHEFGIIKPKNNCDVDILWLTFSTYEKDVEDLKGKNLTFDVKVDNEKFSLDLDVINIFKMTPIMSVALFTNFQMNEKFIKLLKKSNNIEFTISNPKKLAKKFDIPSETFSLNGFVANYIKLQESCKDINHLLIPPPEIKLEPKVIKTYKTKNLITDHSKCDSSKINKYIENKSRRGNEFTVSNDYLYFSYGNDGQDEYEDINVVNICNPLKPKLVTKISDTASQVFGLYTDDKYLYVDSSDEDGNNFQIIDIENNKLISKIKLETFINPFIIKNDLLYIANGLDVNIYDLKNKNNPKLLNKFVASLKKYIVAGIDVDDKYIYLTGNSNLLVYDKETLELLVDREFDYRTSSILVKDSKALLGMWRNGGRDRLISLLDVSNLTDISIEKTQKVDDYYIRRINKEQVVWGEYSPDVNVFNFKSIDSLYDSMKYK